MIHDSSACWRKLVKLGGLDVDLYDGPFVLEICRVLRLEPRKSLSKQLRDKAISVEDFWGAFFSAMEPYGKMMQELLVMFERARAIGSSSGTLLVEFDFGRNIPGLKFDLRTFRTWLQRFRWVSDSTSSLVPYWNHDLLEQLCRLFDQAATALQDAPQVECVPQEVRMWLSEYDQRRRWPTSPLALPMVPEGRFADVLFICWDIWSRVVESSKRAGPSRTALAAFRWEPSSQQPLPFTENWWLLRLLDEGNWAGRMVKACYAVARQPECWDGLVHNLSQHIERVPQLPCPTAQRVAMLEEALSLPIWERRHDLYSAWVGARIVQALGDDAVVHSSDGAIRYSFAGTHLASCRTNGGGPLHLWSELRSPLANPRGRHRLKAIQPDYSLQQEPITYPNSSRLVVECKQYLKASSRGFADALSDYARGRPLAKIVLVNYGPADAGILDLVEETLRARSFIIGQFQPGNPASCQQFEEIVGAIVNHLPHGRLEHAPQIADEGVGQTTQEAVRAEQNANDAPRSPSMPSTVRVRLTWGMQPADLDLHAWIQGPDAGLWHVCYREAGRLDGPPWAELDHDCRDGEGPETIVAERGRIIRVAVHNYSGEVPLTRSDAKLLVQAGNFEAKLDCPSIGEGAWWDAFELDMQVSTFRVLEELRQDTPNP